MACIFTILKSCISLVFLMKYSDIERVYICIRNTRLKKTGSFHSTVFPVFSQSKEIYDGSSSYETAAWLKDCIESFQTTLEEHGAVSFKNSTKMKRKGKKTIITDLLQFLTDVCCFRPLLSPLPKQFFFLFSIFFDFSFPIAFGKFNSSLYVSYLCMFVSVSCL